MSPFHNSQYKVLPAEEKVEDNQQPPPLASQTPVRKRPNKAFVVLVIGLIAFASLFAFLGTAKPTQDSLEHLTQETVEDDPASYLMEAARATDQQYLLGVGKADITGPVVELNFMGYASLAQIGTGLRQRIYSRAFIVGDVNNPDNRFVYLVLDTACGDTAIRYGILEALANLGSDYAMYGQSNVAVTGTHAHSGPGAWLNYLLPQITSLGFDKQSYQAIVDGVVLSIQRAHKSLEPGYLSYADTNITDANINRSLWAYLANPAEERAQYDTTTDTMLTMLRFQRASDGLNTGVLCWHSVHGTSMLENNTHVTGDNKGLSSYLFEQAMKTDSSAASGFVAAFSQSSVGDTSPNVLGAWCDDGSGEMCTLEHSTCNGTSEACHGRGPEFQKVDLGVSSCYEIGRRVYAGAIALYDSFDSVATAVSDSSVKFYHTFQDMRYFSFPLPNGTIVQTCPAALGYSFAGGTTDGPGAFDFVQGDNNTNAQNPFWALVSDLLTTPSAAQVACQSPKPVLLDVGEMNAPYAWSPNIVDIQSFRVGQLIIIVTPSEATTMTGRRWKAAVAAAATNKSITTSTPKVVLGGPANTYAHYAATPEEYGIQRYEGASTLYGPWESYAYIHLSEAMIGYLAAGNTSVAPAGPSPPDNVNNSLSFIAGVVYDGAPIGKNFGDVLQEPNAAYTISESPVVNASFVGANPRNNLRLEGTFTEVQMYEGGVWTTVRDDSDWFLEYTWYRDNSVLGTSHVVISWETESYAIPGTYRIVYHGDWKDILGTITAFNGTSGSFTLS